MIRVETAKLVQLLGDLAHTAGDDPSLGAAAGVLLHTTRGYVGAEPGQTDLLVGTSTNKLAVGHTNVNASGQLHGPPMLWPIADVRAVIASFKPRLKENKEHALTIQRGGDDSKEIVLAEDPHLFGDGLTLRFSDGPLDDYPRHIFGLLTDVVVRPGAMFDMVQARTDFSPSALAPFVAVAKARKATVELYRYHQKMPVLVQIGTRYRGVLSTSSWPDDSEAAATPDADVYPVQLPELDAGEED